MRSSNLAAYVPSKSPVGSRIVHLLKITVEQNRRASTLKLEGKLVGPWVEELERTWRGLTSPQAKYLVVDLCGLMSVSARGKQVLEKMFNSGADLIADAPLTRHIVEEIMRDRGGRKRKRRA